MELYPTKDENDILFFKRYDNQYPEEVTIIMDFESLTFSKDNIIDEDGCGDVPFTEIVANHKPFVYSFVVVDKTKKILLEEVWAGHNAHIKFIDRLLELENQIFAVVNRNLPMPDIDAEMRERLDSQVNCSHCNRPLSNWHGNRPPCIDHCHFSGTIIGESNFYTK